jgi:hypothetical protein
MQPLSPTEHHTYPALFLQLLFGCLIVVMGLIVVGMGIINFDNKNEWLAIPVGIFWTWFSISSLKFSFERHSPIEIDDTGISAMAFGREWKSIQWSDVQRIERVRRAMFTIINTWRYGYEFVIVGSTDTIYILDSIGEFPALLNALNSYAQRYSIPLVAYDRGDDTKAKIKTTVMDRLERKRLLKEGIRTEIADLKEQYVESTSRFK